MGAWGTKPDQNDDAADLFDSRVAPPFAAALDKLFKKSRVDSDERWARIGVIYKVLVEWPKAPVDADTLRAALYDLEALADDEEWQHRWHHVHHIRESLAKVTKLVAKAEDKARYGR